MAKTSNCVRCEPDTVQAGILTSLFTYSPNIMINTINTIMKNRISKTILMRDKIKVAICKLTAFRKAKTFNQRRAKTNELNPGVSLTIRERTS